MSILTPNTEHVYGPQLYKKLPRRWRTEDHSPESVEGFAKTLKYHERFCYIFGDTYDQIKRNYIDILKYGNPLECPASVLSRLAQNRGWALEEYLDDDFKRLLIRNIRQMYKLAGTERGIWYAIYTHTGIGVRIHRCNCPYTVKTAKSGYLDEAYNSGDDHVELHALSGPPQPGDRIWVHMSGTIGHGIIDEMIVVVPNQKYRITLVNGLAGFTFPKYSHWTIRPEYFPGAGSRVSIGGRRFMKTGDKVGIMKVGSRDAKNITAAQQRQILTLAIEFPFNPVIELGFDKGNKIIELSKALVEYMKPYRSYYSFICLDKDPFKFVVGLSKVGSRDRVGEA